MSSLSEASRRGRCPTILTTVSVWDHEPDADEVLEKRLAAGWKPTASQLGDGDAVEGHAAACVLRAGKT